MNEEPYFSLNINEEWKETFTEEALSYLKSAQEKIFFSLLDINGFYTVSKAIDDEYKVWNKRLFTEGISDLPDTTIDYFGNKLPSDLLLDKLFLNYFSTIHSFFDTYAQFLHSTLFSNQKVPKKLYFNTIENKIKTDPSMTSIDSIIVSYTSKDTYSYIADMNNTNKHSSHISPQSTLYLNNGEQTTDVPAFQKDGKMYDEKPIQELLEETSKFVIEFFKDLTMVVLTHVNANQSL